MVTKIGGKNVSWQHGEKSSSAKIQTLLNTGDKITASEGSFAEITYLEDSCTVRVSGGKSLVIGATSPCATSAARKSDAASAGAEDTAPQHAAVSSDAKVIPASADQGSAEITNKTGAFTRLNRGEGLADANVGDNLKVGDEVFAGPNSSVTIYFSVPACEYTVPASTVYKIPEQPPCEKPAAPQSTTTGGISAPGLIVAGLAGAGAIGGAIILINQDDGNNDNGNPATPN